MTEAAQVETDETETIQSLIKIETSPVMMSVNFNVLKAHLETELKKYDVLVTEETLPGAKKLATDLNKTAAEIKRLRKEEVEAVSAPIKAFENNMRELEKMCKDGRLKLTDQIKVFEDETREELRKLLDETRDKWWKDAGVKDEFKSAEFDDLIILSNLTAKKNLSAKAKGELQARINADKSMQDKVAMRLIALENASYKAGLTSPLTENHVAIFLRANDDVYDRELARILDAEIERETLAKEAMRKKLEAELREREEAAKREELARQQAEEQQQVVEDATPENEPEIQEEHESVEVSRHKGIQGTEEARPSAAGVIPLQNVNRARNSVEIPSEPAKDKITVTATFEIEVSPHISDEAIKKELLNIITDRAGIKALTDITIKRNCSDHQEITA